MAKEQTDDELNLRRKARRRLIGAVALTLAVVVILPMVLDSEPKSTGNIDLTIPDSGKVGAFVPRVAVPEGAATLPSAGSAVVASTAPAIATPVQVPVAAKPNVAPSQQKQALPVNAAPEANKSTATRNADKPASVEAYVAQVGAYANAGTAKQELKKLKKWGFKAYTEKAGDKIRVRVGPYPDRDKAEKAGHLLEKHGLHPVIVTAK
jgi:DedD protein